MTVTNTTLSNIHLFATEAQYNTNKSSVASTDIALIKVNDMTNAYDMGIVAAEDLQENGYVKYENGLIVQWGWYARSASATDTRSFPITFPNQCFIAVVSDMIKERSSDNLKYNAWIVVKNNSEFLCGFGNGYTNSDYKCVGMVAIGY